MTFFGERKIQESMSARLAETERFQIPDGCLRLSESFFSIEGEGLLMGTPCYLVRFAGCNLRCGFCDTKFSSWYDTDAATEPWITVFQEIVKVPGWISYTGGEPFFRQENELRAWAELVDKVAYLQRPQKVETSGTVDPPDWFPDHQFFYSIAPKTSGMGKGTFLDPGLLEHILRKHAIPDYAHIKFVIGAREKDGTLGADFQAIKELMVAVPSLKKYPIIFQPEGLTESTSEYLDRCRLLVEAVKNDPEIMAIPDWRVLPQWHNLLWKNARRR